MNALAQIVKVGIADMNIVRAPQLIRTSGLGSCVGLIIYDLTKEIAGLTHIMLPDSSLAKGDSMNRAKYADTSVPDLIEMLVREGARPSSLKAKMAGGAQMFQFTSGNEMMRIGPRNIDAVKVQLDSLRVKLVAQDVGGNSGRTIEFNPQTGVLQIRTVNCGVKDI